MKTLSLIIHSMIDESIDILKMIVEIEEMQLDEHSHHMFLFLEVIMHEIFTIQALEPFHHEI